MLVHTAAAQPDEPDVGLTLSRAALLAIATGQVAPDGFADAGIEVSGDPSRLTRLLSVLQDPDPGFPILTPARV